MEEKKLSDGDFVVMTPETREVNSGALSVTGTVIRAHPNHNGDIRIRRTGLKTIELWHPSAWQLADSPSGE